MSKAATAQKLDSNTSTSTSSSTALVIDGVTFRRQDSDKGSDITYKRASQLTAGEVVVAGIYLGTTPNTMYPEKLDYKFQTSDGKTVVVNEAGNLGFRMKSISAGNMAAIIYQGKNTIEKGPRKGKQAHNFEVQLAD